MHIFILRFIGLLKSINLSQTKLIDGLKFYMCVMSNIIAVVGGSEHITFIIIQVASIYYLCPKVSECIQLFFFVQNQKFPMQVFPKRLFDFCIFLKTIYHNILYIYIYDIYSLLSFQKRRREEIVDTDNIVSQKIGHLYLYVYLFLFGLLSSSHSLVMLFIFWGRLLMVKLKERGGPILGGL